jgi:hypothetical protein
VEKELCGIIVEATIKDGNSYSELKNVMYSSCLTSTRQSSSCLLHWRFNFFLLLFLLSLGLWLGSSFAQLYIYFFLLHDIYNRYGFPKDYVHFANIIPNTQVQKYLGIIIKTTTRVLQLKAITHVKP